HEDFMGRIQQFEEVAAAYIVAGPSNYVLHVRCRNLAAFSGFIVERLNRLPGMRDICSYIVMRTLKDSRWQVPLGGK
ncbi:Lrp/AsnC family transcriptional regulator, partial [Pseudomonas sp. MWU13-2860]